MGGFSRQLLHGLALASCAAWLLAGAAKGPAWANDSAAETPLGGLVFTENDAISMDSEDLYISFSEVRVKYQFTNTTDKDVTLTVAFPLPEVFDNEGSSDEAWLAHLRTPGKEPFTTLVDGKRVELKLLEEDGAFIAGQSVAGRVKALGFPLDGNTDTLSALVNRLDPAARKALLDEGLLWPYVPDDATDPVNAELWYAQWTNKRFNFLRKQVFPAGKTVQVEHRYQPLTGVSIAGTLDPPEDRSKPGNARYFARFCAGDALFKEFDAFTASHPGWESRYQELWLSYLLKTGANWKGPIKDFRLVVDFGPPKPGLMGAFCPAGAKDLGDGRHELVLKNYEPQEDVNILVVKYFSPEDLEALDNPADEAQ